MLPLFLAPQEMRVNTNRGALCKILLGIAFVGTVAAITVITVDSDSYGGFSLENDVEYDHPLPFIYGDVGSGVNLDGDLPIDDIEPLYMAMPPATPTPPLPPMLCSDECLAHSFGDGGPYANNSYCQDGADGDDRVTGTACAYGTDCTDCGPRYQMPPSPPPSPLPPPSPSSPSPGPPPPFAPPPYMCSNTCRNRFGGGGPDFANNKHCQDGHPGAEGNTCMLGTDCDDCGLRYTSPPSTPPPPI